jgi:hypothetical protein
MGRLNLTALWLWPLLAAFVAILMSFEDPFRLALAAAMLAAISPVRRAILALDPTADVR